MQPFMKVSSACCLQLGICMLEVQEHSKDIHLFSPLSWVFQGWLIQFNGKSRQTPIQLPGPLMNILAAASETDLNVGMTRTYSKACHTPGEDRPQASASPNLARCSHRLQSRIWNPTAGQGEGRGHTFDEHQTFSAYLETPQGARGQFWPLRGSAKSTREVSQHRQERKVSIFFTQLSSFRWGSWTQDSWSKGAVLYCHLCTDGYCSQEHPPSKSLSNSVLASLSPGNWIYFFHSSSIFCFSFNGNLSPLMLLAPKMSRSMLASFPIPLDPWTWEPRLRGGMQPMRERERMQ
jgi:hypothetical protein